MPFNPDDFDKEETRSGTGFNHTDFDEPSSAVGAAKQFGAGIAEGATPQHLLGSWVNKSDPLGGENLTSLPAPKPADYANAAQNALPEPQGAGERMARSAGSALPMAAGLPIGGVGAFPAAAGLGAVGRASEEAIPGSGPYAAVGAGLLGLSAGRALGGIRRMLKEYKGAPDLAALRESENTRWEAARELGHKFPAHEVSSELGNMKGQIFGSGAEQIEPALAPKTYGILGSAEERYAPLTKERGATPEQRAGLADLPTKPNVPFGEVDALRRNLQRLTQGPDATEREAAHRAIHGIYDYMDRQPGSIGEMSRLAREETAAAKRLTAIDAIRDRAINNGGKDRDFRNALKAFIQPAVSGKNKGKSQAMREGFLAPEIEEMKNVTHASTHNALQWFGHILGGSHVGWGGPVGMALGHPLLTASTLAGRSLQGLSGVVARARYDRLARLAAKRSPLAREMDVQEQMPSAIPLKYHIPRTGASIIAPAINSQRPTQQTFAKGGRVKRSFQWSA